LAVTSQERLDVRTFNVVHRLRYRCYEMHLIEYGCMKRQRDWKENR